MSAPELDAAIEPLCPIWTERQSKPGCTMTHCRSRSLPWRLSWRAQRRLYTEADAALVAHITEAKQPVRDDELRHALIRGIAVHARDIVKSINVRTCRYGAIGGLCLALIGFCGGAWWQKSISAAQITAAETTVVAVHDGFGTGLKSPDAEIWLDLIRINNIRQSLRDCQPLKQPHGGSACSFPLWTMPPPPQTETPGTH